jgi:hypothetical protein
MKITEALKECCNTSNNALGKKQTKQDSDLCERSVGTVFQPPDPDAICSQDEETKKVGGHSALNGLVC